MFEITNTNVSGSALANTSELPIYDASKLNTTVIGDLSNAQTGDQLTWDGEKWVSGSSGKTSEWLYSDKITNQINLSSATDVVFNGVSINKSGSIPFDDTNFSLTSGGVYLLSAEFICSFADSTGGFADFSLVKSSNNSTVLRAVRIFPQSSTSNETSGVYHNQIFVVPTSILPGYVDYKFRLTATNGNVNILGSGGPLHTKSSYVSIVRIA